MQVSHNTDFDTHAIVGGKDVGRFRIAQTAEFYTVLSSTLYTRKPEAVVREILCNAWDAHIAAGCKDTPIKVTLTEDSFMVRDYGKGIPAKDVPNTYCVYGGSTKAEDEKQTGGFGLGSKAPFSISDHFTVSTFNEAKKTVFAISRGSSETDGEPDYRVMVQVPTTESGVEVKVPLSTESLFREMLSLVKKIVLRGSMNVELNGRILKKWPLKEETEGLFLFKETQTTTDNIYVRYGSVVYPVLSHDDYAEEYKEASNLLAGLSPRYSHNHYWKCLLEAPAGSMSVAPSREAISVNEPTNNCIKKLLTDFLKKASMTENQFSVILREIEDEAIEAAVQNKDVNTLLVEYAPRYFGRLSGFSSKAETLEHISTVEQLVLLTTHMKVRGGVYYQSYATRQWKEVTRAGINRPHVFRQFYRLFTSSEKNKCRRYEDKIVSIYLKNMLKDFNKIGLSQESLVIRNPNRNITSNEAFMKVSAFRSAMKYSSVEERITSLLQHKIVVAYSRNNIINTATNTSSSILPSDSHYPVYFVSRKKGEKEEVVKALEKIGFSIIDVCAEEVKTKKPVTLAPSKPKPEGLIKLSVLNEGGVFSARRHLDLQKHMMDEPHRITDFRFVLSLHDVNNERVFKHLIMAQSDVVALIGEETGICRSATQKEKFIREGVQDAELHVIELVLDAMISRNEIARLAQAIYTAEYSRNDTWASIIRIARRSDKIVSLLKLPKKLTKEDWHIARIGAELIRHNSNYSFGRELNTKHSEMINKTEGVRNDQSKKLRAITSSRNGFNPLDLLSLVHFDVYLNSSTLDEKDFKLVEGILVKVLKHS
jgi:hypothetical protein